MLNNDWSTITQGQTLTINKLEYVGVSISKDPGLFIEYEMETSNDLQTCKISNIVALEDSLRWVLARDLLPLGDNEQRSIRVNVLIA